MPIGPTGYNRIVVASGPGGRWHPDQEGKVVLEKAYEGRDWTVTRNERDGGIYVMDGVTWFRAKE